MVNWTLKRSFVVDDAVCTENSIRDGRKEWAPPACGPNPAVNGQEQTTREIAKPHAAEQEISIRFRISRAIHNRSRARENLQSTGGHWRSRPAKHRHHCRPFAAAPFTMLLTAEKILARHWSGF
jgi:hypothetical protein